MSLLDELVQKYAASNLETVFGTVGLDANKVHPINRPSLKEVTLAQWLLESGRATSKLANEASNFAGLKWRSPDMVSFATPITIKVPSEDIAVDFCKFNDIDQFIVGYWKFLTREPYKGLEENTTAPDNFLGFLQRKGYAADPAYVTKVLKLIPEAQQLLAKAGGIIVPLPLRKLQVTRFPQEVEVKKSFSVGGIASPSDSGKVLLIKIDDRFPSTGTTISSDGEWQFNFVFLSAGSRRMSISTDSETVEITIKAHQPVDAGDDEETPTPIVTAGSIAVNLLGSVGVGGINKSEDVKAIKKRLKALGYTWVGDPATNTRNRGLDDAIRLFQSVINGLSTVDGDGRIDLGASTHRWLQAKNAPGWQPMPKSDPSIGFVNFELEQTGDNHDFGTTWLANAILSIAKDFHTNYRTVNPGTAPFAINDVSIPHGGDTPDHAGHETGLMCDVLLPRIGGDFGGTAWFNPNYDQKATRAMIQAIRRHKLVRAVFFNDPDLTEAELSSHAFGHDDHIHFEIDPPVRE